MNRAPVAALAIVVALLAGFGIGHTVGGGDGGDGGNGTATPSAVDIGFSQDMSVHHEQAVLMANFAMTRGRPAVRAVADGILISQSQEVGLMRGWLRLWRHPAAAPRPMAWMTGMADMGGMAMGSTSMPGMASSDQLERLYRTSGKRFDILFLQLMIRHHQGGIAMAQDAMKHAAIPAVRTAAKAMIVEQVEDIGTMRAMLETNGAKQLPAPS